MVELNSLYKSFTQQTNYIKSLTYHLPDTHLDDELAEFSLIALQDAWNCFIRDIIVTSAVRETIDTKGTLYSPSPLSLRGFDDVLSILQAQWISSRGIVRRQQNWWEPSWYDQHAGTTACNILRLNNRDISAALSTLTNPIEELRPVRNFAAHKGRGTRTKIDDIITRRGLTLKWHKARDVSHYRINTNEYLIEEWIRRFHIVAKQFI